VRGNQRKETEEASTQIDKNAFLFFIQLLSNFNCAFEFSSDDGICGISFLMNFTVNEAKNLELFLVRHFLTNDRLPEDRVVIEFVCIKFEDFFV
jgi:hypothetical protein